MALLAQLLVNGLVAGSIYGLVASGFALVFYVTKALHFAHGAIVAIAAYTFYLFYTQLGINFWLSLFGAVAVAALLGILVNWGVYRPLRQRKASSAVLLIASLAALVIGNNLILLVFGSSVKPINVAVAKESNLIAGTAITSFQVAILAVAAVLIFGLWFLLQKTRLGKAMRAVSDNKDVAQTVGINPERVYLVTFVVASILAGIAGVLNGIDQILAPQIGTTLIIMAFAATVIGGLGKVYAAVIGGLIVGVVENLGILFLPSGYKGAIVMALLFVFLIFKPQGLFGGRE